MLIPWQTVCNICDRIAVGELGASLSHPLNTLPIIGENPQSTDRFVLQHWFKLGSEQYIKVVHEKLAAFAWAPSDGSFASILTNDSYFDDGVVTNPPTELLPESNCFCWQKVVLAGRQTGDRYFHEGEYGSRRCVVFGRFEFWYRHGTPASNEPPVCIKIMPKIELPDCCGGS